MHSTRNYNRPPVDSSARTACRGIFLIGAAMLTAVAGCVPKQQPETSPVTHGPLVIDEAMQTRNNWPVSAAQFQNGETAAWPTEQLLVHPSDQPKWQVALSDGPIFLVNSLATPIVCIFSPPWRRVIYPNAVIEPSYNAMPPLPAK